MAYILLAIALAPGIAITLFIYWKDRLNKEPLKWLLLCFLFGILSIIPAFFLEKFIDYGLAQFIWIKKSVFVIASTFAGPALVEELLKYAMLRWSVYNKKSFDEPLDGIVYMVMVAMGFATMENIFYVFEHGLATGIIRMFLAVPGHACWAIIIGYNVGLAKFNKGRKGNWYIIRGLFLAILLHGLYDSFLFLSDNNTLSEYISSGALVLAAIGSYIIALIFSIKALRIHRKKSKLAANKQV